MGFLVCFICRAWGAYADLWIVREKYLSHITDLRMGTQPIEMLQAKRDDLLVELHSVYADVDMHKCISHNGGSPANVTDLLHAPTI